jgi:hypothetical protein
MGNIKSPLPKSTTRTGNMCWKDLFPWDPTIPDDLTYKTNHEVEAAAPHRIENTQDLQNEETFDTKADCTENVSTKQQFPTAFVDLYSTYNQWESFIDELPLLINDRRRLLHAYSKYYFELHLTLPQSDMNLNLGMFMVEMELYDDAKVMLARSRRPAIFPYRSTLVWNIRRLCTIAPLVMGLIPETTTMVINTMNNFDDHRNRPLRYVKIVLMLPSSSSGSTNNEAYSTCGRYFCYYHQHQQIQILEAMLTIGKELSHLQLFMKQRYLLSALIGVSLLMILQATFIFSFGLSIHRGPIMGQNTTTNHSEQRQSYMNDECYHVDIDGESFSLHSIWDKESMSKDDVWDGVCEEEENSLNDEFWDSISYVNHDKCQRHYPRTVVSSGSEKIAPGSKKTVNSHPMEEIKTKAFNQRIKKSKSISRNRFSDDTNSSNSHNLYLSRERAGGAQMDHPTDDAADYSDQLTQEQDRQRRKSRKSWKKKANRKWKRRVSPPYENERLEQILKGQVEPYEIFTGKFHLFSTRSLCARSLCSVRHID